MSNRTVCWKNYKGETWTPAQTNSEFVMMFGVDCLSVYSALNGLYHILNCFFQFLLEKSEHSFIVRVKNTKHRRHTGRRAT